MHSLNTYFVNPRKTKMKTKSRPSMVAHTCNSSTQKTETGKPQVGGQPKLYSGNLAQKKKERKKRRERKRKKEKEGMNE
jgi:hypothetical protein